MISGELLIGLALIIPLFLAQEETLELDHPRVGKEQHGIVRRDQR